jgi:hypothetical protein
MVTHIGPFSFQIGTPETNKIFFFSSPMPSLSTALHLVSPPSCACDAGQRMEYNSVALPAILVSNKPASSRRSFAVADSLGPQTSLKWGDSFDLLSDERKNELRGRLNDWDPMTPTYGQSGPFAGEHLKGLEVFWLAACALARKDGDPTIAGTTLTDPSQYWPTRFTTTHLIN